MWGEKKSLEIDAGFFSGYSTVCQKVAVPALYDNSIIKQESWKGRGEGGELFCSDLISALFFSH